MAGSNSSQNASVKESFLFKYLLSSTAAAVAETGVDFDVQKWNKKEVDNYVSTMLLEIEKGEKELAEKERWLKEMGMPESLQTDQNETNDSIHSTSNIKLEKLMGKENDNDECDLFQTYENQRVCNYENIHSESQRGLGIDGKEYEERKKKLAEIRKADYNDYLKNKNSLELKMKKDNCQLFPFNQIIQHDQTLYDTCGNEYFDKSKSCHINTNEKALPQISSHILLDQHNKLYSTLHKNECKSSLSEGDCQQMAGSISNNCPENTSALNSDCPYTGKAQHFTHNVSSVVFPPLQNSDRRRITALYKDQLDKQIEEKQRLQSLHREYAELCDKKNEIRAMQQIMRMQDEYADELKKHDKTKAAFKLQEERCKKLEEFIKKDNELRKPKFQKHKPVESNKYSSVHDFQNVSISSVLANLSDIRQKAIRTQRMLDQEINSRHRKNH